MSAVPEPVSVVIPVYNAAHNLALATSIWVDALNKLGQDYELILVNDGSTDATGVKAEELVKKYSQVRVLTHESPKGFGACLRTALPETRYALFFYTALDYPYTPQDLRQLLMRIDNTDEIFNRKLDLVSGCRTGQPVPTGWKLLGYLFRGFCRIGLGLPLDPLPGWLGFKAHRRSWTSWILFGVPLVDINSAFKVFRKSLLEKFPIQSDGEFVHAELIAKSTFVNSLMDELPLTPRPDPIPNPRWADLWKILSDAEFTPPAVEPPPVPPPTTPTPTESVPAPA